MPLGITPLPAAPLGALVTGWDPAQRPDDATRRLVLDALERHRVLVFRGHRPPTDDQLVRFVERFGRPLEGSEWFRTAGRRPEILPVTNIRDDEGLLVGIEGAADLGWHADYSFVATPGKISFLDAVELPDIPPRTYFCDMYRAAEALDEDLRDRLRGLRAVHSVAEYVADPERDFAAKVARDRARGIERPDIPQAEHPVMIHHPDTGREILYVSGVTRAVVGLDPAESADLLAALTRRATATQHVYGHDWQVSDLVVFDTLGTVHRRDAWDPAQRRLMRQLTIACDDPPD